MSTEHKNELETVDALQEWGRDFGDKGHPVSLTLFRAAAIILADIQPETRRNQCESCGGPISDNCPRCGAPQCCEACCRQGEAYAVERLTAGVWVKATDINRPSGWYWTRLGDDDESCPMVVFIALENDGDAAPDFRVECAGEDSHTAKRLKQWEDRGWEFMEIPMPEMQPYQRAIVAGLMPDEPFRLPMGRIKSPLNVESIHPESKPQDHE